MSKKPKRIRAEVNRGITPDRDMYVLWRGDIRALAEQFVRASAKFQKVPEPQGPPREYALGIAMYLLADAGMTPGKGAK